MPHDSDFDRYDRPWTAIFAAHALLFAAGFLVAAVIRWVL